MKKLITLLAVGGLTSLSTWAADTVELQPSKLTGTISLSSETIKNG